MGFWWRRASFKHTMMVAVTACVAFAPSGAFAWGSLGHALIGRVAAEQALVANSFWAANSASVGTLSNVPDAYWKKAATIEREQTNHWFQIDSYLDPSQFIPDLFLSYVNVVQQYSKEHVTENGTSSWRSEQMFLMAIDAFKNKDYKSGLEVVGALSHYIGDMSQPLHMTINYDGQLTNQKGIHSYFETAVVKKANQESLYNRVSNRARSLLNDPEFRKQLDGVSELKISYLAGMRSISELETVLRIDKSMGRNNQAAAKQLEVAVERLSDGAATLAYLLGRIAQESSMENKAAQVKTQIPVWIPSEFQGTPGISNPDFTSASSFFANDCL